MNKEWGDLVPDPTIVDDGFPYPYRFLDCPSKFNKAKEFTTLTRIRRYWEKHKDATFVVGYSGGKDSAVVLDLISRVIPAHAILIIYCDTGIEFPKVRKWTLKTLPGFDLDFRVLKPEKPFYYYLRVKNYPFPDKMSQRWCCGYLKERPLKKCMGEVSNPINVAGIRREESSKRCKYEFETYFSKYKITAFLPILDWTLSDIWGYIDHYDLPYPKEDGYPVRRFVWFDKGRPHPCETRIGCWACDLPNSVTKDLGCFIRDPKLYRARLKNRELYARDYNAYKVAKIQEEVEVGWFEHPSLQDFEEKSEVKY
ncbi:MAG: phosphoadenosine phosphosulfate reductase family protein [Candidatus Thorarchaeota archaeon]